MKLENIRLATGLFAGLSLFAYQIHAQSDDDIIVLDEVTAEDVPIEESILATTRPISSVYGSDRSVLDTPRNVNIISREQLDAISIKDVRDFSKLTSSSYTKTNFGAPTTPNLRGQEADLMINGVRRGHSTNGNGVPINFNSVESVNIVKGPAGAVYGTSNYVGGYADLITKRAYFEDGGSVKLSVGSYDQYTANLDVNVPISETVAARVSVEGKDWQGFWDKWYQESTSVYGTVTWKPNDKYRLDVMGEYYKGNYTENWGINRVTDALVNDNKYLPNDQTDAQYEAHIANLGNGVNIFSVFGGTPGVLPAPGEDNPTQASVYGSGGFATISPIDVNSPIDVDRSWKLSAPGDDSNADVFWAQAIQEFTPSDTLKVINNTYFHYKDRSTFSSYHYSELMRDNYSIDNRLQFIQDFEADGLEKITLNYGARLRYQEVWSVNHFFNEPVNFWDLSRDVPNNFRVLDQAFAGSAYIGDQAGRGVLSKWYVGGGDDDLEDADGNIIRPADGVLQFDEVEATDSETLILAPFVQADVKINDQLSILGGFTIDYVKHTEKLPSELRSDIFDIDYSDHEYDAALYNANISLVAKPTVNTALYVTYNEGEHYDVTTGGAVTGASLDNSQVTKLVEVGFNASLFDNKVYLGAAAFHQEYTTREQDGSTALVETDGFEIELNYQPNRNFFATIGYSIVDSKRTTTFFASPYTVDRADETGGYYISPTFGIDGSIEFENPGVPEHLFNALVQYKFDNGLGIQANLLVWGEMNSGYGGYTTLIPSPTTGFFDLGPGATFIEANTVRLDMQFEVDAKIFYEYEDWMFSLSAFNITNEENWDVNNSGYGNGSAVARPDTTFEFSVAYSW